MSYLLLFLLVGTAALIPTLWAAYLIGPRSKRIELPEVPSWGPHGRLSLAFKLGTDWRGPVFERDDSEMGFFFRKYNEGTVFVGREAMREGPPTDLVVTAAARLYGLDPEGTASLRGEVFHGQVVIRYPEHARELVMIAEQTGDL